jgi:hypothetical protein
MNVLHHGQWSVGTLFRFVHLAHMGEMGADARVQGAKSNAGEPATRVYYHWLSRDKNMN